MNPQELGELRGELGWVVSPPPPPPPPPQDGRLLANRSSLSFSLPKPSVLWPCHLEAPEEPHSYRKPQIRLAVCPQTESKACGGGVLVGFHPIPPLGSEEG